MEWNEMGTCGKIGGSGGGRKDPIPVKTLLWAEG